jgi:hypothetical protein
MSLVTKLLHMLNSHKTPVNKSNAHIKTETHLQLKNSTFTSFLFEYQSLNEKLCFISSWVAKLLSLFGTFTWCLLERFFL